MKKSRFCAKRLQSLIIFIFTFISINTAYAQLSGTYLIDANGGGNYTGLADAVNALNTQGMSGEVILQLAPGIYNEKVVIDSVIGNSLQNQIIIESLTGNREDVTMSYTTNDQESSNYLIRLKDTKGVIIRNITFDTQSAKSIYGRVIELMGFSSDILIEDNHFIGNRNSSAIVFGIAAGGFVANYFNPDSIRNLTVQNNLFNYFSPAVDSEISYILNVYHENVVISHNQFIDCDGINLSNIRGLYFGNNLSKRIEFKIKPLVLNNSEGEILIEKNIAYTTLEGFKFSGIRGTKDVPVLVRNNFLSGDEVLLTLNSLTNFNIANNTFISTAPKNALLVMYSIDSISILNNIFYHKYSKEALLYYYELGKLSSDYNCYFAPESFMALDLITRDTIQNFDNFKTAFNNEIHGKYTDPNFASDTTYQTLAIALIDAGIPLTYITEDIEGEPRTDGKPDIGADESTLVSNLTITNILANPTTVNVDEGLTVTWSGENAGQTTFNDAWTDNVYLSKDELLDENDILLGSKTNNLVLAPNDPYAFSKTFLVDLDEAGDYFVLVKLNAEKSLQEDNTDNVLAGPQINIKFTNRPNLVVSDITLPAKINSGAVMTFEWTVTNNGNRSTTENWFDYLYFSSDLDLLNDHENFDPNLYFLVKIKNPVGLAPGESYTSTHQFKLPVRGSGLFYLKVITDFENTQNELDESLTDNTTVSEHISVDQTPLSDLVVTSFNFPETAFSGEWIDFSYTIKNNGTAKTAYDLWVDYMYITTDSVPNRFTFTKNWRSRQEIKNWKELDVGEEYVIQESIKMPYCEADTFYVYLLMDTKDEILEISEDNNAIAGSHPLIAVLKPSSDLVVERLEPQTQQFVTEQILKVEYDIYNRGLDAAQIFNNLQDAIYLSKDRNFDPETDTRLSAGLFLDTLAFAIDDYITRQQSIKLPDSLFGEYYLVVNTDDPDKFCEVPFEDNNAFFSEIINIQMAPAKDLVIRNLQVETSAVAGEKMTVNYELFNDGVGAVENKRVIDSLFLVAENGIPNKHNYIWYKERDNFSLASKASVSENYYFSIPIMTKPGDYRLVIKSDARNSVYEFNAEQNNTLKSGIIKVTRDDNKLPDLDIARISLPGNIQLGETISMEIDIKNLSQAKTNTDAWKYRVLLLDAKKESVVNKQFVHFGYMNGGASITEKYELQLPNGIQGDFKLVLHVDINYKVSEYYKINNADTIDINIGLSPWADLVSETFIYPDTLTAGQLATLSWTDFNQGAGASKSKLFVDRIYVSKDNKLDKSDIQIHKISTETTILSNSGISQTEEFRLNSELEGFYYLLIETDASNQEYEHTDEDNNVLSSISEVYILKPKPIDLEPVANTFLFLTGSGKVEYSVRNNGPNIGYGSWVDAAFLSTDAIWDKDDIFMGYQTYDAGKTGFAPNESYQTFIKNNAGFVKPDTYYVIIKTDVFNYIPEVNDGNNSKSSEYATFIDMIEELIPGVVKDSVFRENRTRAHYYKLNANADKGYLLTLDGKNSNNSTELFYKTEDLPERGGNFDYKGANDFTELQQIIVPSKDKVSKDYVLAYADYIFDETMDYTLLAEEKEFSIVSITPEFGGNEGNVVVDLNGFDFSDSLRTILRNANDTLVAVHSIAVSNIKARAHFNTNSIDPGTYDVVLQRLDRGDETVFSQSFVVQETSYTDFYMTVNGPDRVLIGRDFVTQVNFSNRGNINDYDMFILVAFYMNNHTTDDFSIEYMGDGISDELPEELRAFHPFSNDALIKDNNAYYFYTWLPVFAAQSSGQYSFKSNIDLFDTLNVSAQIFANPISDIHFSGHLDDLKKTRFVQDLEGLLSAGLGSNSGARVAASGECFDDPEVVEAMIWKGVRAHAEYIGGGIPGNKSAVLAAMLQEGLKAYIDPEAHDRAAGLSKDLMDKRREIVLDPTQKSAYDHLIKNLDNCLTPEITNQLNQCLVAYGKQPREGGGGYETVYRNKCKDGPPKNTGDGGGNILDRAIRIVKSWDPNEIIGPEGVGEPKYISTDEVLSYRINFENLKDATAAAQRVAIENKLVPELDERRFRLKEIGWGDTIIQLPEAAFFTGKFDLGEKYSNYQLQLTAGIDATNRRVFWLFQTIDPATGAPPDDFDGGFLPPNDSSGIGEGYVSYTIKSRKDLPGGTEIINDAVIVFDQEKSLNTNVWTNTIRGESGVDSYVNDLPAEMTNKQFLVSWQANESFNNFQPIIQDYTIFVAKDSGQYEIWQSNTKETEAIFTGEPGSSYQFYSIARTASGDSEYAPAVADATTRIAETETVTSLRENELQKMLIEEQVVIYPNPSHGEINLAYKLLFPDQISISIVDLSGRRVFHKDLGSKIPGNYQLRMPDFSVLKNGLYIIKIEGNHFNESRRWIKN